MEGAALYGLLGMRLKSVQPGVAELEMDCDARHANIDGAVHGGILCLLADAAMGFAVRTDIAAGWTNRTVNLTIDWYSDARVGDVLRAVATVVRASKQFRWTRADVVNESGNVICAAHSLSSVRPPQGGKGTD